MNDWTGNAQWSTLSGMLVSNGSSSGTALPSFAPATGDYAVEARIQIVKLPTAYCCYYYSAFGVIARYADDGQGPSGYIGRVDIAGDTARNPPFPAKARIAPAPDSDKLVEVDYTPGSQWHTYCLDVHGEQIRFLIDGHQVLATTDIASRAGNRVGLYDNGVQINVNSFKVKASC
jgi:hypothetical protein